MSIEFSAVKEQERHINVLLSEVYPSVVTELAPHSKEAANGVRALADELRRQWQDFARTDRKLNIAVVGRVKAGKSTFLNTVIFGGRQVLPQAFTPKTASLTKIEYAPENAIEVEFYTPDEWRQMEDEARSSAGTDTVRMAKELVEAVRTSGIAVSSILAEGTIRRTFSSEEELADALDQYTGADGEYTPLVKCVTLYQNNPDLEGISIVDTPGLNDPVVSRTQRTRDFLASCDVVFFLSPASQFLDAGDVELLQNQLPTKGVARLCLLVSRFDDGLMDAIYDADSLAEAASDTKKRLAQHAKKIFRKEAERYTGAGDATRAAIFRNCEDPLFLSSLLHNMTEKSPADYTEIERKRANDLNEYGDFQQQLPELGDLSPIENELTSCIAEKDATLLQKIVDFVPRSKDALHNFIKNEQTETNRHIDLLTTGDGASLEQERRRMEQRIHEIEARLAEYFGTITTKMERAKIDLLRVLREDSREYGTIATKTGSEFVERTRKVSTSHWYNPFSWGTYKEVDASYTRPYSYLDVNDALENIRHFGLEASSSIERAFADSIELKSLKQQLLRLVVDNFDAGAEDYDPAYFRLLAERSLNNIELPVIHINVDGYLSSLAGKWSGEVRDASDRSALQAALGQAISQLFDNISARFTEEVPRLKSHLDTIRDDFGSDLLRNMNTEYEKLQESCADKERSIERLKAYAAVLEDLEKRM